MRESVLVVVLLAAVACSGKSEDKVPAEDEGAEEPAAATDASAAAASSETTGTTPPTPEPTQPAADAAPVAVADPALPRITAEHARGSASKVPPRIYDALVEKGSRWTMSDSAGDELTLSIENVRTVGKARVADLVWNGDAMQIPAQAVVTAKGLSLAVFSEDGDELAARAAAPPTYLDPPYLDDKKSQDYATIIDGMVCVGFDFWRAADEDDICGDETCAWRICLVPGAVAGAEIGSGPNVSHTRLPKRPKGEIKRVSFAASSEQAKWKQYRFGPALLGDRAVNTCWQAAKGKAVGEWVDIELAAPAAVDALEIANGYQTRDTLGDLFLANARVRTATISLDGEPTLVVDFAEDERGYARVDLGGRTAKTIRLTIDAIWPGTKWQDVAISEIVVLGAAAK